MPLKPLDLTSVSKDYSQIFPSDLQSERDLMYAA